MRISSFIFLAIVAIGFAEETELPADSRDLLASLKKFEDTERLRLQVKLELKRKEVIEVLQRHVERETKAGNIKLAIALRKVIKDLGDAKQPVKEGKPCWLMTWEEASSAFKATQVTVTALRTQKNPVDTKLRVREGDKLLIVPNPDDRWTGGGTKSGVYCDYRGYDLEKLKAAWMRMYFTIGGGQPVPVDPGQVVVARRDGALQLFVSDGGPKGNKGEIRVAIVPRK